MSTARVLDWAAAPAVAARPALAAAWFEVREQDLALWNEVLLGTDTPLFQYPFWNDPYRALGLTPQYLAWGTQDRPITFVSILTVKLGPAKIGLVFRGPTCLEPGVELSQSAIAGLLAWARKQGYIFIRFTHSDSRVLAQLAASGDAHHFDAFPYFLDFSVLSPDYVIDQFHDEDRTLATFDREVRRKLRRAEEAGYEFRCEDSPEALAKVWPLYQDCARRKHFRLERPLSVYMKAMRLASRTSAFVFIRFSFKERSWAVHWYFATPLPPTVSWRHSTRPTAAPPYSCTGTLCATSSL